MSTVPGACIFSNQLATRKDKQEQKHHSPFSSTIQCGYSIYSFLNEMWRLALFMLRQAQHERKMFNPPGLLPFALSLSKGGALFSLHKSKRRPISTAVPFASKTTGKIFPRGACGKLSRTTRPLLRQRGISQRVPTCTIVVW